MPLTVEMGTGDELSDSYVTVAQATALASSLGFPQFADLDEVVREDRCRKATVYLDAMYKFKSRRKNTEQALQFPRERWPNVPVGIRRATAYLAACGDPLAVDSQVGQYKSRSVRAEGAVQKSEVYRDFVPSKKYRYVDSQLEEYTEGTSGSNFSTVGIVRC